MQERQRQRPPDGWLLAALFFLSFPFWLFGFLLFGCFRVDGDNAAILDFHDYQVFEFVHQPSGSYDTRHQAR